MPGRARGIVILPPVIHIGWARAASTAFRQNFLKRHPQIRAVERSQPYSEGPSAMVLQHVKVATGQEFRRFRNELCSEWRAYHRHHEDQTICITDEELSIGLPHSGVAPAEIARRCGFLFPNARILAIVRDQVDAIRSFYALSQMLRQPETTSLPQWTRHFFSNPMEGEDFTYLFAHMTTLRAYLEWCPKRDIFVLPYDRLKSSPGAAYRDIAQWLGISEEACALFPNEMVNVSPPIRSSASGIRNGQEASSFEDPAPNEYSPGQEDEIRALFRADNSELEHEFGVTLSPPN